MLYTPLWKGVMIVFHVTMSVTGDTPRKWKYQGSKAAAGSSSFFFFSFFSSSVFSLLKPYAFVLVPLSPCVSRLA